MKNYARIAIVLALGVLFSFACGRYGDLPAEEDAVCGNGVIEVPELCDDNNANSGDGCSETCRIEAGWACDGEEPCHCIPFVVCGNGVIEALETCDDSNSDSGDGCSAACQIEFGWTCNDQAPSVCTPASGCGNGIREDPEVCDDGYVDACGTCNADCSGSGSGSSCGDGEICPEAEICDDGYTDDCGTCNADCSGAGTVAVCGDGAICPESEFCDDGDNDGGEGECVNGCLTLQICGNGWLEGTEVCDDTVNDGGEFGCLPGCLGVQICGDGTFEGTEVCDDGGLDPCGDCNLDCSGAGSGLTCTISSVASGAWDDPAVWNWNRVPESTDDVVIAPGTDVEFSGNSEDSACQDLEVQSGGTLTLGTGSDVNMVVEGDILVDGTLEMQDNPLYTSTLEIQNSATGEHGVIVSDGGTLSANCTPPTVLTSLSSGYVAGSRSLTVVDATGLAPGERITVGADDGAEGFFIESINGQVITMDRYADKDQAAGGEVYKLYTVLTAPSAANTLTVANVQGIEVGDVLTVGPSTASRYDAELGLMVTDVFGNEITVDRTLVDGHAVGAEVIKTNRRCRLRAADPDYNTYLLVEDGGVLDLDYVEVSYIGHDVLDQEGITLNTSAASTPLNGCSVHDGFKLIVLYQGTNITLTSNAVFDYESSGIRFEGNASDYNNVLSNVVFCYGYSVWARGGDYINISYNTVFSSSRGLQAYPDSDECVIHANVAHSNGQSIHLCTGINNTSITFNRSYWSDYGIYVHLNCSDNLIANNISYANINGIYVNTALDMVNHVLNNTCDSNQYGFYATDLSTGTIIRNNIFTSSLVSGIEAEGTASVTNTYNNVWSTSGVDYVGNAAAGTGEISVDPLFVSSTDRRYLLQSTYGYFPFGAADLSMVQSPCVDAGDPNDDYSSEPTNSGGQVNLGAYGNSPYASVSNRIGY